MKSTLRLRLSFSHLLVLIIGMTLAGILVWTAVENLYLSTQKQNLLSQAELTALALGEDSLPPISPEPYSQTTNVTPGIHTRLLDQSGAVIIGVPLPEGEEIPLEQIPGSDPGFVPTTQLLERMEIQSALSGKAETAVRRIDALDGQRVLYAAAPVFNPDQQVASLVYLAMPLPPQGLPGKLTWQLTGAILAGGLIASLIGLLLAGGIARPLEQLDRAAADISGGDLNQQVAVQNKILELSSLGKSFNHMSASLRESEELKDAFIADITHELRTPLTVLKGTLETLEDGAINDLSSRDRLLSSMERETERLIEMVNQLLLLARNDAGRLDLNILPLNLAELIRERVDNLAPLAAVKDLLLTVNIPPDNPEYQILADRNSTAQVIDNLLDNALRHAPPHSEIKIDLEKQQGQVRCWIADQGPGIPEPDLAKIFDRFYRVETARDRQSGGTGLGLSIARALVEAQGGKIWAHSQEGAGASFCFSLPQPNDWKIDP